jgi:hypothetical protein
MIIYFNSNGDITSLKPERVYQGSNDVDQFIIVAPFNTASTIELTFTLPNGQVLSPYILSGGTIFTNELNIWSFLLKSDITRFAGQVRFGVRVLGANGKVLATGSDTFVVERGTAPTLPPEPTPDVYEQILELLGGLSVDKVDRVDVSDPDYIVGYTYSKDGIKTPNVFYYNFNAGSVIGYDNQTLNNIKGAIFVLDIPTQLRQIEYLFADDLKSKPKIFTRQVYYDENKEVTIVTPFVEIGWDIYGDLNNKIMDVLSLLGSKQDKTDNSLQTNSKQVVGAINENKTNIENNYNVLNNNKLDKNFNLLVERTFAQLTDWVAVRSGSDTLKMSLETLRTYLTQGLVGLSFVLVDELPPTGVTGVIYLVPLVENIVRVANFEELPETGLENTIYITEDNNNRYQWNIDTEEYESYSQGYEEYIWLEEINKYELIGSTQVDLTGYATELWVTENFVTKTQLSGGTTGQILTKKSDSDLDVEWTDIEIPTVNLNGVDMLLDPDKTYLVIKIPADNDTFTLLTGTTGSPNYTIDWGDGLSETITDTSNPTHEYATAGMYLITISGNFANGIVVGSGANVNKDKIIEVYGGSNYPLSIGNTAFYGCTSLTTAYFPSATSIGSNAFQNCTSLTTAYFPSATSIGSNAFHTCTSLTTAYFPKLTSIDNSAFQNCTSLTTANFPKLTSISDRAFYTCTNLTTANFPNATSIGITAFNNCTSLKELTLGNVTTTGTGTRFTNVKLVNLTIAQDVTDTDIERIKQFYADNGGTFSQSCEIKYGLQVEKIPTLDNDVVRKVDLDTVKNLIPTQVNRYFTEATQTLFAKSFYTMQSDKPTDPIANIDTTITATSQETAQVLARFTTTDGLSSEISLPPQNTEVNIEAVRTAGTQNVRIFARGYIMDDAGNETLLSTSNVATLTNASVNHILLLPIPAYTAPVGSRVVIEILAFRVSGSGTHTARIRVNDDTMSKWSYNRSLADLNLDAKNITYNNTTSGLTADNVQDAVDELNDKIDNKTLEAVEVSYDNTISGLSATNVQSAINELQSEKIDKSDIVTTISGTPSDIKVASESAVASGLSGKVDTTVITTTAPNVASTDDTVPTSQAVYEALTSASGLTLSDNLDSPSSSVGLSTLGANNLLEKKLNKIQLNTIMNSTTNDITIYTDPSSQPIQNQYFTLVYGVREVTADPYTYNSITFKIADNTTSVNTTYNTTHYDPNPASPTTIDTKFGGILINTTGTNNESLRVQLTHFNGATTSFPTSLIIRDLIVYSKN